MDVPMAVPVQPTALALVVAQHAITASSGRGRGRVGRRTCRLGCAVPRGAQRKHSGQGQGQV